MFVTFGYLGLTSPHNKHIMSLPIALGFVYFPPESATYNCLREDYILKLEGDIARMKDEYMILVCGDMNAGCTEIDDWCMDIIGSEDPTEKDFINDMERWPYAWNSHIVSKDKGKVNKYGKSLIGLCKGLGIRMF